MESASSKVLEKAVELLGNPDLSQEEVEEKLRAAKVKELVAHRLTSFIPEAFGMVAARHMRQKPTFLTTFSAVDEKDEREEIPFSAEPIFALALARAETMYRDGPKAIFDAVSMRSGVMEVITDAVERKALYDGVVVSIESGVPAEAYREVAVTAMPFWKSVVGELCVTEVGRLAGSSSLKMVMYAMED